MNSNINIKLKFIRTFLSLLGMLFSISILSLKVNAYANDEPELIKGFATAYIGTSDKTCTGDKVRSGICGGCKEYIGKTIILYHRLPNNKIGKMIGIYECLDTGSGTQAFQEGRVIDVWVPNSESVQMFADLTYEDNCEGKVFIQVIDAKG